MAQGRVEAVHFTGLRNTRESFLRQYITTSTLSGYDSLQLALDRQRLLNLNILFDVRTEVRNESTGSVSIFFHCQEMIGTLPVFAIGQTENTFWCRAGVQSLNLTGRADKLVAYYQYYDRHSVYLGYATDRLRSSNWGITASLIQWATLEPLAINNVVTNYDYTNHTAYASAVHFFSFHHTLEMGLGLFTERFEPRSSPGPEINEVVQGKKLLTKAIYKNNHLNYSGFYIDGFFHQVNVEFIHAADEVQNFITVFSDFRYFKKMNTRWNWANRVRAGLASNDDNPFATFVLDSYLNIRGVGNRVDRGTGSFVINTEMRFTIFDQKSIAAQGVGFLDFGTWRKPGGSLADFKKSENMRAFTGLGFRLIYKKAFDTMLRVDVGYDYNKKSGVVIGIGQYF